MSGWPAVLNLVWTFLAAWATVGLAAGLVAGIWAAGHAAGLLRKRFGSR
jgi:hypothetical protein